MTKGEIVRNFVVIDVKDKGRLQMSKIKIARWILLEFVFLTLSLDTLSLKALLL